MRIRDMLSKIPSYVQLLITIGGMVFAMGIMYSDVQGLKQEVGTLSQINLRNAALSNQLVVMQEQLKVSERNQERTSLAIENLSASINRLSMSLVRLESRLDHLEGKK